MNRESPGPPREGARQAEPAVDAAAEAPTALLAAASRLLTELEGVQHQRQPAASRPGPAAGNAAGDAAGDAAAPPLSTQRGTHQLGSRLLVALSLIVGADYLSPISLLPTAEDGRLLLSLAAFLSHLPATIGPLGHAAQVLLLYGICCTATRHRAAEAVQAAHAAAQLLATAEGRAAVERQLARLHAPAAGPPPQQQQQQQQQPEGSPERQPSPKPRLLTAQQLEYTCWWRVAEIGGSMLVAHRSPSLLLHAGSARLAQQQLAEVEAAVAAAAAALQSLEPVNPKGLLAAGAALAALQQPAAAAELYQQALQAAREQGSGYYELRAAAALLNRSPNALIDRAGSSGELQLSATARAATAVLVRSAPLLRQCEQGLPPSWWQRLRSEVARAWRAVTTAQAELHVFKLLAQGMPARSPVAPVSPRPVGAQQQQQQQQQQAHMQQPPVQQQQQQQASPLPLQPSQQNQAAEHPSQPGKQQAQLVSGHAPWEAGGPAGLCVQADGHLPSGLCPSAQLTSQLLGRASQFCSALTHAVEPPTGLDSPLA